MLEINSAAKNVSRRKFLTTALVGVSVLTSGAAVARPSYPLAVRPVQRKLSLRHAHTKEILDVVYWKDGQYIDDIIGQLNYLLRDHHAGKSALIDTNLYDFLYKLQVHLKPDERIHVLSGYRTAETNAYLRKTSLGVARNSFHTKGRAVDIYIPGIDAKIIQKAARKLQLGGVGYYSKAAFVHLDTGYARHWTRAK